MTIAILGATGKTGRYLVSALCDRGHVVTAIGRTQARLAALDKRATTAVGDLNDPATIRLAIAGAETVVSLAHARFAETVVACLPWTCRRLILTGSTRKFSSLPDPAADAVRAGEAAFDASGVPGVMLHPSMIYGAREDRNVNRILGVLRRWPRRFPLPIPLPEGGRHTVQPVFVDDVVAAFVAAIERPAPGSRSIVVAGPRPIRYRDMMAACADALGRRTLPLALPVGVLSAGSALARAIGMRSAPTAAAWRRLTEDKAFDIGPLASILGVEPISFEEGLRLKLARGWVPWIHDAGET